MAGKRKRIYKTYRRRKKTKRMAKALKTLSSAGLTFSGYNRNTSNAIQVERKYIQYMSSQLVGPDSNLNMLLNGIEKGSGVSQRIGRRVQFQSLYYKLSLRLNPGADFQNRMPIPVRFIIFMDTQANGVTNLDQSQLLDLSVPSTHPVSTSNVNAPEANMYSIIAPLNLDNRERFRVLVDKVYMLEPKSTGFKTTATTDLIPPAMIFREKFKRVNFATTYNLTDTDTQGAINTNALWATIIPGDIGNDDQLGSRVYFNLMTRMRYTDA